MIRLIKDLKWLSQNKEKLKELLDKQNKQKNNDKNYSLAGVPEYQLNYINDILEADENKK